MMDTVSGLVSVIVPVYNRESLVQITIESILAQTYLNIEIVLVDDGSTDNSGKVLDEYAARFPDKIKVIHQQNTGQVIARNNGIEVSTGEYIAFLDSDDTWLPQKLEKQIPLFVDDVGLVYSGIYEVDDNGNILKTVLPEKNMRGNIYYRLLVKNAMTGGTVVVKRNVLDDVGLFDQQLQAAENWDLWIRISQQYTVDYVSEPLVRYLKHEGNMSADSSFMTSATKDIYRKHIPDNSDDPRLKNARVQAYAYLHYCAGVFAFGKKDYNLARREFLTCWFYVPLYKDSLLRFLRSFLGGRGNEVLSKLRRL